jgi:hypothetical protein
MIAAEVDMLEESTRLYDELCSLEVTDGHAIHYLGRRQEFLEHKEKLISYQGKLLKSGIRDDTREMYMKDAMNWLGKLKII